MYVFTVGHFSSFPVSHEVSVNVSTEKPSLTDVPQSEIFEIFSNSNACLFFLFAVLAITCKSISMKNI